MRAHQFFELRDERTILAERKICLDPPLECREAQLHEPADRRLREGRIGEVGEGRAAPESQRVAELLGGQSPTRPARALPWPPLRATRTVMRRAVPG